MRYEMGIVVRRLVNARRMLRGGRIRGSWIC
jgi:hypothetical protein